MPFGIKTAGASFTRAMRETIGDEFDEYVIVYLDDILIASNSLEEHLVHLDRVLAKLREVGFRVNKEKCEFMKTEIRFLGHTFNEVEAEINEETKMAVRNFPRPRNKKGIQSFLGLVNWDRRFIKNLARMTRPLESLLRRDVKFLWSSNHQEAFESIKSAFAEAATLYLIRPGYRFGLQVDAAEAGLGARLYQYDDEDNRYTIGYASRSLKGTEARYTVTELECLALVWALRKWCTVLLGRHVRVQTDHKALRFVSSCAQSSARIARWMSFLQEFDLEIEHIPGQANQIADTLSRQQEQDDKHVGVNTEKYIAFVVDSRQGSDTQPWVELIHNAQDDNEILKRNAILKPQEYNIREGIIRALDSDGRERIVVPDEIAWELVNNVHEFIMHFGTDKVSILLSDTFW